MDESFQFKFMYGSGTCSSVVLANISMFTLVISYSERPICPMRLWLGGGYDLGGGLSLLLYGYHQYHYLRW